MPHVHDDHEDEGEDDRNPSSLLKLDECGGEIESLDGAEEDDEACGHGDATVPAKNDYKRHQAGGDQHYCYDGQPCFIRTWRRASKNLKRERENSMVFQKPLGKE